MKKTYIVICILLLFALSGTGYSQNSYTTGIGLRGGWTSGLSLKHFVGTNRAVELIVGSRYRGFSITGLYELHKPGIFDVPNLALEYGGGVRIGSYDRYYYYKCDDPFDPDCNNNDRLMTIGLVGILGLEYKFDEIPITIGADLMPYIDFVGWGSGDFIDGSLSIRYILK